MAASKISQSNIPKSNFNVAVVSHCPSQQTATIVLVKKPNVFNRIINNFGISSTGNKDEKNTDECTREKTTFFICKLLLLFFCFHEKCKRNGLTSAENLFIILTDKRVWVKIRRYQ